MSESIRRPIITTKRRTAISVIAGGTGGVALTNILMEVLDKFYGLTFSNTFHDSVSHLLTLAGSIAVAHYFGESPYYKNGNGNGHADESKRGTI